MFHKNGLSLVIILLIGLLIRLLIVPIVYHGDMYNHFEWGKVALHNGLYGIYERPASMWTSSVPNQPPLTLYIFMAIRWLYELLDQLFWWLNNTLPVFPSKLIWFFEEKGYSSLLKIPAILADVGIMIVIYRFTRPLVSAKKALFACLAYFLNPIVIYNSAWWGQTDATVNFFGLVAIMCLLKKRLLLACLAMTICLLIKASLLILLPMLIVIGLHQHYQLRTIVTALCSSLLFAFILTLPFHSLTDPFWLVRIYVSQVVFGTLGNVSELAFTIWAVIFPGAGPYPADIYWLGLPAKIWGYIGSGATLLWAVWRVGKVKTDGQRLLLLILVAFGGFLFLTGMRERYLFPIFPLLALLLAFRPKLIWLYCLLSIIHLINLYYSWSAPRYETLVTIVHWPWLLPVSVVLLLINFLYLAYLTSQPVLMDQD